MIQTIEGLIDENGTVRLFEEVRLPRTHRVLVTILENSTDDPDADDTTHLPALLSQTALAADWDRAEEEEAWSHLQSPKS